MHRWTQNKYGTQRTLTYYPCAASQRESSRTFEENTGIRRGGNNHYLQAGACRKHSPHRQTCPTVLGHSLPVIVFPPNIRPTWKTHYTKRATVMSRHRRTHRACDITFITAQQHCAASRTASYMTKLHDASSTRSRKMLYSLIAPFLSHVPAPRPPSPLAPKGTGTRMLQGCTTDRRAASHEM